NVLPSGASSRRHCVTESSFGPSVLRITRAVPSYHNDTFALWPFSSKSHCVPTVSQVNFEVTFFPPLSWTTRLKSILPEASWIVYVTEFASLASLFAESSCQVPLKFG